MVRENPVAQPFRAALAPIGRPKRPRYKRARAPFTALLLPIVAAGCGGSSTAPSTTTTPPAALRADINDPIGDTLPDARIAVPPDLVHATITVAAQNLTLVVSFAPGTLNRQTTRLTALFDTDLNATTGIRQADGVGADYGLDFDANAGQATILKADAVGCAAGRSCFANVASTAITFVADGMQASAPLSALGGADGRMTFELTSYAIVAPLTPVAFDFLPDINLAPARVQ